MELQWTAVVSILFTLIVDGREISLPNLAQDAGALGTGSEGGRQPERLQQLRRLTAAIWRRGCVTAADAFPQPRCAVDSPFQTELGTARCHTNERLGLGKERGFDRRVRRIQVEKKLRQEYEWEGTRLAQCRSTKVLLRSFVYFFDRMPKPQNDDDDH